MKYTRSYTTLASGKHVAEGHPFDVEIEIDLDEVAKDLAARAVHSKGKKATTMGGAIKCRVVQPKVPPHA